MATFLSVDFTKSLNHPATCWIIYCLSDSSRPMNFKYLRRILFKGIIQIVFQPFVSLLLFIIFCSCICVLQNLSTTTSLTSIDHHFIIRKNKCLSSFSHSKLHRDIHYSRKFLAIMVYWVNVVNFLSVTDSSPFITNVWNQLGLVLRNKFLSILAHQRWMSCIVFFRFYMIEMTSSQEDLWIKIPHFCHIFFKSYASFSFQCLLIFSSGIIFFWLESDGLSICSAMIIMQMYCSKPRNPKWKC